MAKPGDEVEFRIDMRRIRKDIRRLFSSVKRLQATGRKLSTIRISAAQGRGLFVRRGK